MLLLLLVLLAALYLGFGIGANDVANAMGPSVGSRIITFRRAILIFAIFLFLGAILQGGSVANTIGRGVAQISGEVAIFSILFSTASIVILISVMRLPISVSQSIVFSVIGVALISGALINTNTVLLILSSWIVSPFIAIVLAYLLYRLLERLLKDKHFMFLDSLVSKLVIIVSAFVAYALGSNTLGSITGPLMTLGVTDYTSLAVFGALAIISGSLILGRRVLITVGHDISILDPHTALCAQGSAALTVIFFSLVGIPTSTTLAVIGGVVGAGLTKGRAYVNKGTMRRILLTWILCPFAAMVLAPLFYSLLI